MEHRGARVARPKGMLAAAGLSCRIEESTVLLPTSSLVEGDSPRLGGIDEAHVRMLAQLDIAMPPIIVDRPTLRVVDGRHRLCAAVLRGRQEIEAHFFAGDDEEAFILAVRANIKHGLPLTTSDRVAAANRLMSNNPHLSNRAIASITGVGSTTVAAIRARSTAQHEQLHSRIGLDGRVRPVDGAAGRMAAFAMMAANPQASLREIARTVGISPSTVRDVRERLRQGEHPLVPSQREAQRDDDPVLDTGTGDAGDREASIRTLVMALGTLRQDPALRLNEAGRSLLRWMSLCPADDESWERLLNGVPSHCVDQVVWVARTCARLWECFAKDVEGRNAG